LSSISLEVVGIDLLERHASQNTQRADARRPQAGTL
jgi:hypothetical protein